jgi:lipid II:glycine glycyltransferase (peptidoglycan interpeptide bridge formation enzyme)
MKIPITQSKLWEKLQADLDETSFFEQKKDFQYLAILKKTPMGNYLYLPYGPVYEDKAGFENALISLKNLAKKQSAIFIRIEPSDPNFASYAPKNAKKTTDLNPKETWILDLTGKEEDLKSRLPSRLLRYYKNAEKKGLKIETSHDPDDIHYLLDLQKALAKEKNINTFSEDYLKTELKQPFATLYFISVDNEAGNGFSKGVRSAAARGKAPAAHGDGPAGRALREVISAAALKNSALKNVIAAGLVFDDRTTRYNLQGAQSEQGRKFHATGILTIKLILDAAEKGQKTFDFWGIAPENAPKDHPWQGFTSFKKTFAGTEVDYAGTYDLVLDPSKYRLYSLLRKFNRLIRK